MNASRDLKSCTLFRIFLFFVFVILFSITAFSYENITNDTHIINFNESINFSSTNVSGETFEVKSFGTNSLIEIQANAEELLPDPSFELPMDKNRYGCVFEKWGCWIYEGEAELMVSNISRSGNYSLLMIGGGSKLNTGYFPKVRTSASNFELEPGRYEITAYIRGLDIGDGIWGQTTEFMFAGKYMKLDKKGTFGWTKLTYVTDVVTSGGILGPSFGLMAPGYFFVDDVSVKKVSEAVALTDAPILGEEEEPIESPYDIPPDTKFCHIDKTYNTPHWKDCYNKKSLEEFVVQDPVRVLYDFENGGNYDNAEVSLEHSTRGDYSLKHTHSYTVFRDNWDFRGYDYFMFDVYANSTEPVKIYVEMRDKFTTGYWTRMNYNSVLPPGKSTFILPTNLYVGEKSRPGRNLDISNITFLALNIQSENATLYYDNIRLEKDIVTETKLFPELIALDLQGRDSPLMDGFMRLSPEMPYRDSRGYGLKDHEIWRTYDVLQPEALYQDFICLNEGGVAVDVPNGEYHVFVNSDIPSGYWGEFQKFRERTIFVEDEQVSDTMSLSSFKEKYFRHWNTEDLPTDNTFDKYQLPYYDEKEFDVLVNDGELNIDCEGNSWTCCISAIVAYPKEKENEGEEFLEFVEDKRRFLFDNYFKRILPGDEGEDLEYSDFESLGYVPFSRNLMDDFNYNDKPDSISDVDNINLSISAFLDEREPVVFSVYPIQDLDNFKIEIVDLKDSLGEEIDLDNVTTQYLQYRVSRLTMDGAIYSIKPRYLIEKSELDLSENITRTFILDFDISKNAKPGKYFGEVVLSSNNQESFEIPITIEVLSGKLEEVDIPVGPFGHTINLPWYSEETTDWNLDMSNKSLVKLKENGFTTASGTPYINYKGFVDGKPNIDFSSADSQMTQFKDAGFSMSVVNYGAGFSGLRLYSRDMSAMKKAGYSDYSSFLEKIFIAIKDHAKENDWLPVYWNLADEPINLDEPILNAKSFEEAFEGEDLFSTGASSFTGNDSRDPHFEFAKSVSTVMWNHHSKDAIDLLQENNGSWGFYNSGSRWTYGPYMYKAVVEEDMKFRYSWHWNIVAGDPYYALDSREDDYSWCNSDPEGNLICTLRFIRLREGLDDYKRLLTLKKLISENAESSEGEIIYNEILNSFEIGTNSNGTSKDISNDEWDDFRKKTNDAISNLNEVGESENKKSSSKASVVSSFARNVFNLVEEFFESDEKNKTTEVKETETIFLNTEGCVDLDKDGYGEGCALGPDCNDNDFKVNPGSSESSKNCINEKPILKFGNYKKKSFLERLIEWIRELLS